jgi:hypothetical protein
MLAGNKYRLEIYTYEIEAYSTRIGLQVRCKDISIPAEFYFYSSQH